MTVISWSLEFIAGLAAFSVNVQIDDPEASMDFIACGVLLDAFVNFIILPSSYILNNEVMKTVIIAEGWCKLFRVRMCSNKVATCPPKNKVKENVRNLKRPLPIPISTISGNVKALTGPKIKLNDALEKDHTMIKMIAVENLFTNP